jgi:NAD(P)-dependent dehydrogenase (short-subunit alcohol dehydrogenase family)
VDVLVNNAGTFSVIAPVWEADPERWFRDIRVNLYGSFLVNRAVIPLMIPNRRGYIINVVSSGGVGDPHPFCTSYAGSKAGLMRLTEGMAKELAEHNIVVFAVAPPAVLSDMTRFIMEDEGGRKYRPHFADIFEQKQDHPPEVVSDTILRLVDGKADNLTGRYIPARADLDEMLRNQARIVEEDLYTLRIRREGSRKE